MTGSRDLLDLTVGELLDAVAERTPAPAGGSVAALVAALAAALAAMAARFSTEHWDGATRAVEAAEALRARAAPLASADAAAYEAVLAALRLPRESAAEREAALRRALDGAAAVPGELAELALQVATLAADLAERGNPNLRGDAAAAAVLASACATIAANLVALNLAASPEDGRVSEARANTDAAAAAARRALEP